MRILPVSLIVLLFSNILYAGDTAFENSGITMKCASSSLELCSHVDTLKQDQKLSIYLDYAQKDHILEELEPISDQVISLEINNFTLGYPLDLSLFYNLEEVTINNSSIGSLVLIEFNSPLRRLTVNNTTVSRTDRLGKVTGHRKLEYLKLSNVKGPFGYGLSLAGVEFNNLNTLILENLSISDYQLPLQNNSSLKAVTLKNITKGILPPSLFLMFPKGLTKLDLSGSMIEDFSVLNYFSNKKMSINLSRTNINDSNLHLLRRLEINTLILSDTNATNPQLLEGAKIDNIIFHKSDY